MKDKSINIQKTQSLLKEVIPEAFATLSDTNINSINVLEVDCKRGKYDAIVYLDPTMLCDSEKKYIIKHLNAARGAINSHILQATGWFRVPKLKFVFDNSLDKKVNIDKLFERIEKELNSK